MESRNGVLTLGVVVPGDADAVTLYFGGLPNSHLSGTNGSLSAPIPLFLGDNAGRREAKTGRGWWSKRKEPDRVDRPETRRPS